MNHLYQPAISVIANMIVGVSRENVKGAIAPGDRSNRRLLRGFHE